MTDKMLNYLETLKNVSGIWGEFGVFKGITFKKLIPLATEQDKYMFGVDSFEGMGEPTKEDDGYVISCPELNATTQGDTEQEAYRNIIEAMELVLETERKDTNFNIDLRKK